MCTENNENYTVKSGEWVKMHLYMISTDFKQVWLVHPSTYCSQIGSLVLKIKVSQTITLKIFFLGTIDHLQVGHG